MKVPDGTQLELVCDLERNHTCVDSQVAVVLFSCAWSSHAQNTVNSNICKLVLQKWFLQARNHDISQ